MSKIIKIGLIVLGAWVLFTMVVPMLFFKCSTTPKDKVAEIKQEYMAACDKEDFQKARSIVAQFESLSSDDFTYGERVSDTQISRYNDDALKYINDKEIYNLLSKPSRDNDNRIAYLYNSYTPEQLPDMEDVVEVAISNGNEYLAEKLLRAGVGVNSKIAKAAINADMDQLIEVIITKDPAIIFEHEVGNGYKLSKGADSYDEIIKRALNSQVQELYNFELSARPAIGVVKYMSEADKCKSYSRRISDFNGECYKVIVRAVSVNEFELANKVLSMMKPTLEIKDKGSNYLVTESQHQINEARKIIQSAKR